MNVDFFDTNVILYMLDDGIKADTARELLRRKGLINETLANCIRKKGMSWERAGEFIDGIRELCLVANLTTETHKIGWGDGNALWVFHLRHHDRRIRASMRLYDTSHRGYA